MTADVMTPLWREWILVPLYTIALGLCAAVVGVLLGLGICDLGFQFGLIHANGDIDDDAMIITMGFAMAGGAAGFVAGAVLGWRAIWPSARDRAAGAREIDR